MGRYHRTEEGLCLVAPISDCQYFDLCWDGGRSIPSICEVELLGCLSFSGLCTPRIFSDRQEGSQIPGSSGTTGKRISGSDFESQTSRRQSESSKTDQQESLPKKWRQRMGRILDFCRFCCGFYPDVSHRSLYHSHFFDGRIS